jgi:Bacterial antitoxin of type II TA system, VapB
MARSKTTITVDRVKVDDAVALTGARSTSAVIDIALERLIRAERLRRDIAAYRGLPQGPDEIAFADAPITFSLDDDDVDYDALYGTT